MKKFMAVLLAVCLMLQLCTYSAVPAQAATTPVGEVAEEKLVQDTNESFEQNVDKTQVKQISEEEIQSEQASKEEIQTEQTLSEEGTQTEQTSSEEENQTEQTSSEEGTQTEQTLSEEETQTEQTSSEEEIQTEQTSSEEKTQTEQIASEEVQTETQIELKEQISGDETEQDTETLDEIQSQESSKEIAGKQKSSNQTETNNTLEVQLVSALPFHLDRNIHVEVRKGEQKVAEQSVTLNEKITAALAHFNVEAGEYTVVVNADGFAQYSQNIQVEDGWRAKIQVASARIETENDAKVGWLRLGDVNNDKKIDDTDTEVILQAIRNHPDLQVADLNQDGEVNIADLQYHVQSINEEQQSLVEKLAIPSALEMTEGSIVDGDLTDLLDDNGNVSFVPANPDNEISSANPVSLTFTLARENQEALQMGGIVVKAPMEIEEDNTITSEIASGEAVITYIDSDGNERTEVIYIDTANAKSAKYTDRISSEEMNALSDTSTAMTGATVTVGADGSLTLNFGKQIAVKKVLIRITGTTKKEDKLVNIAKVEFVNNMEERIPAPQLDTPTLNVAEIDNEQFKVSWNAQNNVTGYEVYVSGPVKKQDAVETQIVRVNDIQHLVTAINDKPIKNFAEYKVKVRSVNGDWKSPWSDEITASPKPTSLPASPDNVKAEGGYLSIQVSWKDMDDANGYMVYYKKTGDTEFKPVVEGFEPVKEGTGKISANQYKITGLEQAAEYEVYVIGWNELGWGQKSLSSLATTKDVQPPTLPKYKLLNTSLGEGQVTAHIVTAIKGNHGGAAMVESPLDVEENSALGTVDDNYASYWQSPDWDNGVAYPVENSSKGITVTFDDDYKMSYLTFAAADEKNSISSARVWYWNTSGASRTEVGARVIKKLDENNKPYYVVKFQEAVTANQIRLCLSTGYARGMMVGEIHFHNYDSLEDDILGLYVDEMHTTLRDDVTKETISQLEQRLEEEDSGEKHPLYKELQLELKTAREILETQLDPSYEVDNNITAKKDGHVGFGGLNAWQPLGKVAYTGESLIVYVGHNTKRTGDSAELQLIVTQQHAESNSLSKSIALKVGRNEITIPKIADKDFERGGQLYVAYTGNNSSDKYAIRISGGDKIPYLSVYGKTGEERKEAISAYINDLEQYVTTIEQTHEKRHTGVTNVNYEYDEKNCILNATDIMLDDMMYSVPATQVWSQLQGKSDKVSYLDNALAAMDDTMTLFYQHKGLNDEAGTTRGNNNFPSQHLNIRYMRMFAGAFMYASGNHIGVEWNETAMASGVSSWDGFGWGIAHEIGHNINQNTYAIAEITNNYFAQLLTKETKGTRFDYKNVYDKVTSGAIGRSSSQATQLALYWQLHLAFDDNKDDRHIFDNYEEQFNQLFFARVDTYSRNPGKAPQSGLTLGNNVDQNLMRLSCAAANKNILSFFERWGMVPDEDTKSYAAKYGDPDEKALYYVNDDARDYRSEHKDEEDKVKITGRDVVKASVTEDGNQAKISITTEEDKALILGYEITRSMTANGKTESKIVGFVPIDADASETVFVDTVSSVNNRVLSYEVRAVDKFLNYSNVADAGSVKIQTDGELAKSAWTVETNMTSSDDTVIEQDEDDPDSGFGTEQEQKTVHSIDRIIDNDKTDAGNSSQTEIVYTGVSEGDAEITIDMHKSEEITAFKYKGSDLSGITVQVSKDGSDWTTVKENVSMTNCSSSYYTIWFDAVEEGERANWIGTYDARYVKLTGIPAGTVSIQEIEICGPSGDNLEFRTTDDTQPAIGKLTADYQYGENAEDVIPAGSLIFSGIYKGNPAYNIVMLYDTEGNVIGAKEDSVEAEQVIFADVPKNGNLGETSDGIWIYYVKPGQWSEESLASLKGVRGELYRVDNAQTLEGERVVSDTKIIKIPDVLPDITLTADNTK